MTKEELHIELDAFQKEFDQKTRSVYQKYANSNSTVKEGDIVKDHIGSLKVVKIGITIDYRSRLSSCTYYGIELKKDLTPMKKGSFRTVYQSNIDKEVN